MESNKDHPVLFGKYEILEELGRGGFGIVYRAFDTVLEVEQAIKELYPNLVNDPAFVNRFKQEARIAARLDHPNLVPVHDFGQIDGKYYLAMGYMPGGSLKDLLVKEGPLSKDRALEVMQQVGAALAYAHSQGVIHRDLKPSNILFDSKGKARVSDLGFAKLLHSKSGSSMSTSGGLVGTPAYMAPEVWKGKGANASTDVYSLVCILVEMLTARSLFDGESTPEIMFKHFEPLQLPEDLPDAWMPVIEQGLEKKPEERIGNVDDLISRLQHAEQWTAATVPDQVKSQDQEERREPSQEAEKQPKLKKSEKQDHPAKEQKQTSQVTWKNPDQPNPQVGEEVHQMADPPRDGTPKTRSGFTGGKPDVFQNKTPLYLGLGVLVLLGIFLILRLFPAVRYGLFPSRPQATAEPEVVVMQQTATKQPEPSQTPTNTRTSLPTNTATITPTLDGPFEYVVMRDDSVASIAEKYDVSLDLLLYANGLGLGVSDQYIIREGDIIIIPAPWQRMPTSTLIPTDLAVGTIIDYYVEPGVSLALVTEFYRSTVAQIISETNRYRNANDITPMLTDTSVIVIGDLLKVPVNITTQTPATTPALGIGSTQVRERDGMEMVYVPEVFFTMGSEVGDDDEKPVRQVYLDAYWIDKYEVSNAQYALCVNANACDEPADTRSSTRSDYYGNPTYADYPVIYVKWNQATAYCQWAGGDLPTEAQWEKAARGTDAREYPWGNETPNINLTNYDHNEGDTTEVGNYPGGASPYGVLDMAGNVWEWVRDNYGPYNSVDTNNPTGPAGDDKIIRGGGWYYGDWHILSANRSSNPPTNASYFVGFRCVSPP